LGKNPFYLSKLLLLFDFSPQDLKLDILPLKLSKLFKLPHFSHSDGGLSFFKITKIGKYLMRFLNHRKCLYAFKNSKKSKNIFGYAKSK
jgi:hypothetical protein